MALKAVGCPLLTSKLFRHNPNASSTSGAPMTAYAELEIRFKRLNLVREAAGVLQWDMETLMPTGGAAARTEPLATLRGRAHPMLTAPALGRLPADAEGEAGLTPAPRA